MSPIKLQTDCKNVCCMEKQQSTALGSSCLGTVRIWGGGEIRGRIQNRRPREGVQWQPQRDLSRGSLLSAVFKKAMAALAVRVPRQRVRNKG